MADISNSANIINVSDITERVDELREERALFDAECLKVDASFTTERNEQGALTGASLDDDGEPRKGTWEAENAHDAEELTRLENLLSQCQGYGGDHQWEGNRYPQTLIADDYFPDYAREFAEDVGAVSRENAGWIVIDWNATAEGLKRDYNSVDYDGSTYWYRG